MAYHHIDPDDLQQTTDYPCDKRALSDAAELTALHAATYEMAPGESLARTYHYHEQREELFYVIDGTVNIETPETEFVVGPGEVFIATPDSPHRAANPADATDTARVLGVGAPKSDIALPYAPEK